MIAHPHHPGADLRFRDLHQLHHFGSADLFELNRLHALSPSRCLLMLSCCHKDLLAIGLALAARQSHKAPLTMLDLVIFDADGVLFESAESNIAYYNAIFERIGEPPLNPDEERACIFMAAMTVFELRAREDLTKLA